MTLLFTFIASLLLGMRHATDADHVVAVTTIVTRERSVWRASGIGALWGVGHTATIFLVGGAIILFKVTFSQRLGLSLEMAVAVMLIVLGAWNLFGGQARAGRLMAMRPLLVGFVHGLAGSAAATMLILPLIDDPRWATLYLIVFGLGTIVGMAVMTLCIAAPSAYATAKVQHLQGVLRFAAGAVSFGFGVYLVQQIGFTDGLFTSHPVWMPR